MTWGWWPFFGLFLPFCSSQRIAFGSCSTHKNGKAALWPQLADKSPTHLILLGDNIYADSKITFGQFIGATPNIIDLQYQKLSLDTGFNDVLQSIDGWKNVYATWDDHDYGVNNGDKNYEYRNESLKAFLDFFHYDEHPLHSKDGGDMTSSQYLSRGGVYTSSIIEIPQKDKVYRVKIILLDTRYFKDPRSTSDGDFLGPEQWAWLEQELNDNTVDVILLGSSIQILPTQKIVEESWSVFPHARERLLQLISLSPCLNIILLSGDVHMAEVSQAFCTPTHEVNFEKGHQPRHLWEFTSSGLSHTFVSEYRYNTDKTPKQNEKRDSHNYLTNTHVATRGYLASSLFNMYQATYPGAYREHRFKDLYKGVHFGTIDFIFNDNLTKSELDASSSSTRSPTSPHMVMTIWDHYGLPVITKTIPIHPNKPLDLTSSSSSAPVSQCTPFWGPEKPHRYILFLFCMAVYLFLLLFIPLTIIIWLVSTSIFYICYESEYKRRERIERRYQEEKKKKLN